MVLFSPHELFGLAGVFPPFLVQQQPVGHRLVFNIVQLSRKGKNADGDPRSSPYS